MTKKEHLAQMQALHRERDLLPIALQCAVAETPDAEETAALTDSWHYTYQFYRSLGAAGGIVVVTARVGGQRPSVTARYLEDLLPDRYNIHVPLETRQAIERLYLARQRMEDAQYAAKGKGAA